MIPLTGKLPKGIVPIIQTPFDNDGELDLISMRNLLEDTIAAGCDGLIRTGVAGEISYLTEQERFELLEFVFMAVDSRVTIIVVSSSDRVETTQKLIGWSQSQGGSACLIQVPAELYNEQEEVIPYFKEVLSGFNSQIIIQDFQINGPGMDIEIIRNLVNEIPTITGIKIETMPAGPKYTAVKEALGDDFYVSGGWAVTQFMEALDRGVDAMIPECSMVRVYKRIYQLYQSGDQEEARSLFHQLLPILSFTNQEVGNSIKFFKRLLVEKKILTSDHMRWPEPHWDEYSLQTVDHLIQLYLTLEGKVTD